MTQSFMLMQSSGIHLTIDLKKNKKRYTGYSLLSESHSIFPLGYKYLETLAERCIDQKQKQNALLK